jgi:hypothetical protein
MRYSEQDKIRKSKLNSFFVLNRSNCYLLKFYGFLEVMHTGATRRIESVENKEYKARGVQDLRRRLNKNHFNPNEKIGQEFLETDLRPIFKKSNEFHVGS